MEREKVPSTCSVESSYQDIDPVSQDSKQGTRTERPLVAHRLSMSRSGLIAFPPSIVRSDTRRFVIGPESFPATSTFLVTHVAWFGKGRKRADSLHRAFTACAVSSWESEELNESLHALFLTVARKSFGSGELGDTVEASPKQFG